MSEAPPRKVRCQLVGQKLGGTTLLVGLVGGIGPSFTAVGDHVGILGGEHDCVAMIFVIVAKLFIYHKVVVVC